VSNRQKTSLKQDVTALRRARILEGAGQVFAEKGYHNANTKEIAAAAGVAEGTIYNYFESKRALLFALLEEVASESIVGVLTDTPSDDPRQFFDNLLENRSAMLSEHGQMLAPIMAEIFIDAELREELFRQILAPMEALLEQAIRRWIDEGQFRELNPTIIAYAIVGASMFNILFKHSTIDERYGDISMEAIRAELIAFFLSGIGSSPS
jgi:AcrR family transcriptional regulator